MRFAPIAAFLALSLVWGSEWMLAASLPAQPALLSTAARYGVAALLLLPWAVRGRLWRRPLHRLAGCALLGVSILSLPQILIFMSGQGITPAWSLLALALVPVFLAVSGRGEITTAVCGMAGIVFLIADSLTITARQLPWLLCPFGAALLLAWALAGATERLQGMSLVEALFVQFAVAGLVTGLAAMVAERQAMRWSVVQGVGLLASAVIATVGGYVLFFTLLARLGPATLSMLQWLQTLVAAAESAVLMHVRPGWEAAVGALLVIVALARAFADAGRDRGVMLQITRG